MSTKDSLAADSRNKYLSLIFRSDYRWLTERLRFRLGCGFQAEEIASESFARLAALANLEDVAEPRAMLTTIAQRVMYARWRRRDLERAYLDALAQRPEPTFPSPEDQSVIIESLMAVDEALEGLSVKARTAFLYSQLDGLTYAEIAERLDVSVSTVRQYMIKALSACYSAIE